MTWLIIIVTIIVVVALLLPICVKTVLNRALRKIDGYKGRIDGLQINLWGSKISFHGVRVNTDADPDPDKPLLFVPTIIVLFKWKQLLRRILDLNIVVEKPQFLFIAEKPSYNEEDANHSHELPSLKNAIEKLMSFLITVEVRDGQVRYVNNHSHPSVQVATSGLNLAIYDFSNRSALSNSCSIVGSCFLYEGAAAIKVTLLPLEPTLTLDLNLELKSIKLVLLNDLLKAYGKVDVSKGTLNLYAEVAVADNSFKGYIKPLLKDVEFISAEDRGDTIFQKIWERIVAGFYNLFENSKKDQVATKIPIEGRLDDPDVRIGVAIIGILRNAFVKALTPSLENLISFRSLRSRPAPTTKVLEIDSLKV